MSKVEKGNLTVSGNTVRVSMPFAKVDEEKRLVSGWATLDNLDTQGDVVLAEASAKAFSRARGNIREMHQPLAVGKMVDFREDEYFDQDDKKFYRGIFVTARVSKGAQDTWEKVLDGTLSGFSIGGEINEAENGFNKDAGTSVRFIKDYDLTELSLVDNPANQKANIESFQKSVISFTKSADGTVDVELGEVSKAEVENVFVCPTDDVVVSKASESESCPKCGTKMENAGWFEAGEARAEKVQRIVTKFLSPDDKEAAPTSEGGVEMGLLKKGGNDKEVGVVNPSEEQTEENPTQVPVEATEEDEREDAEGSEEVDEASETEEEEAETPDEVEDEATEIQKRMEELHEAIQKSLEDSHKATEEKVAELSKKVDDATDKFLKKASDLEEKISSVGEKLTAAKNRLTELENSLEKMNSSDAIRKSADLTTRPAVKDEQHGTSWNGAFSGNSSGFSVDNLM